MGDGDVLFVAGDLPSDVVLEEDWAVAICANCSQVRQYLLTSGNLNEAFSISNSRRESPKAPVIGNAEGNVLDIPDRRGEPKASAGASGKQSSAALKQFPFEADDALPSVQMGFGFVGTGAQQGECGKGQFENMVACLGDTCDLKPMQISTLEMDAMCRGESTMFLSHWTLPISVAKNGGALAMHVISRDAPSVRPVGVLRQLGLVQDLPVALSLGRRSAAAS
eukprot:5519268-Pyramimonas_sp.AAC.1